MNKVFSMPMVDVSRLEILIVEDNLHFRTLIRSILQALNMTNLYEAEDGIEALDILSEKAPDLVILDWKMEGMDGVECVRHIRSIAGPNRFVPIIMVTGYTETSLMNKAREAGVNGFLGKPLSPQSLLSRISGVMDNPRPYYDTDDYFGPDRRTVCEPINGTENRVAQRDPVKP